MASSSALKLAAACMLLLLCIESDLARPALALSSSTRDDHQEHAMAGELLLRELMEHELAEELGLPAVRQRGGDVGGICPSACQTCLVVCAVTCVLNKEPIACFAKCAVSSSCLGKSVASLPAVRA
ncbi:hypothetical protein HU200_037526 [Digitaria exilis]|uniref:Uncharacterized protein n=1 Tax=Digitaria exilis TaxID=1010633 RepID=A0A835BQA8_9POAL|nr:hypothetical protein HU200_037526 [Digitaria exilis]